MTTLRRILHRYVYDFIVTVCLLGMLWTLLRYPSGAVSAAKDGLALCANVIVPSLFPFFVLSTAFMLMGYAQRISPVLEPVMRKLFNVGGACAAPFLLGFVGGYPVGAKSVIALYKSGGCTRCEAERMMAFCNNSGPAFIFGVVGAGIFSSSRIGLCLYGIHAISSILVGMLFRWHGATEDVTPVTIPVRQPSPPLSEVFVSSVSSSFQSVLSICGFVIFFTVVLGLMQETGLLQTIAGGLGKILQPIGLSAAWSERLLKGILELSSGVWSLKEGAGAFSGGVTMAAFMLGWAGFSVHCQVLSFLAGSGLRVRTYILGKLLHGLISAVLTALCTRFLGLSAPVLSILAGQVDLWQRTDGGTMLAYTMLILLPMSILFLILARIGRKSS